MNKLRPTDIASIVFSALCAVLGICMLGMAGAYLKWVNAGMGWNVVSYINFGMGSWVILCAAIGIAAGVTMSQGVYACSIVMYVFGILGLLGSGTATVLGVFVGIFGLDFNNYSTISTSATIDWINDMTSAQIESSINSIPTGLIVVNYLGFILMIVASCVVCCGTCCGGPTNQNQLGGTTTVVMEPPGYNQQPASGYGFNNDAYALNSYKQ